MDQDDCKKKREPNILSNEGPRWESSLFVGKPNTPNIEGAMKRMEVSMSTGFLTNNGPLVQELESKISGLLNVPHVVCMANATLGLQLALQAKFGLGFNDGEDEKKEIIVPSWTFVASAHAVEMLGYRAVFCDCEEDSHLLSIEDLEKCITPRTIAVLGVHVWGRPCHVEKLREITQQRGIALMFDAAHAFGCSNKGGKEMIGGFGECEVFSFHATKFFNCGEGGAVTTHNAALAERLRFLRNFGFLHRDRVVCLGTNAKLSELHAGLGLSNFECLDSLVKDCTQVWKWYQQKLSQIPGIRVIEATEEGSKSNHQYVVCHVHEEEFGLSRNELCAVLEKENVNARRYFTPSVHLMKPYGDRVHRPLPVSLRLSQMTLVLPGGPSITEEDVQGIHDVMVEARVWAKELKSHFEKEPYFDTLNIPFSFLDES